jgi:nuclear control of ATPase protein 2
MWMSQASDWIQSVKTLICQVIRESLKASTSKSLPNDCSENDFDAVQQQWIEHDNSDLTINLEGRNGNSVVTQGLIRNREQQYRSIVTYIDSSTTWRLIGEGEKIRLRDVFGMNDWNTRLDLLGIPSSILIILLAHTLHIRVVVPYWSTIRQSTIEFSRKAFEILEQRVWVPLKGIYDDIMNRSPSMMSALGLDIEETSLDHMLRDLNFGDGTPATRQDVIRKAPEQYEHDLSHGLFANFARDRLIRLLLIQVQQLKVGMLSALETIDVLIVGIRIHFKVLAAIPAILIA